MAGSDHVQVEAEEQQIPQHTHVRARLRPLARHLELHNTHLPPAHSALSTQRRRPWKFSTKALRPAPRAWRLGRSQHALRMHSVCHQHALSMPSACTRHALGMHSACTRHAIRMQLACNQNAIGMQSVAARTGCSESKCAALLSACGSSPSISILSMQSGCFSTASMRTVVTGCR